MNKTLMIIIAVVVIFAGIIMSGYNSLVSMNENVNGKCRRSRTSSSAVTTDPQSGQYR